MTIITDYVAPGPSNPYAGVVAQLAEAGEGAAYVLEHPTEGVRGETTSAMTERVKFQKAAREAGYTAKLTEHETFEDGYTRYVFVLVEKRSRKTSADSE